MCFRTARNTLTLHMFGQHVICLKHTETLNRTDTVSSQTDCTIHNGYCFCRITELNYNKFYMCLVVRCDLKCIYEMNAECLISPHTWLSHWHLCDGRYSAGRGRSDRLLTGQHNHPQSLQGSWRAP